MTLTHTTQYIQVHNYLFSIAQYHNQFNYFPLRSLYYNP